MIITFYSYKGGTGRTMALANIAALLALRGRKVLAVDFDLEAPGLWRYFTTFYRDLGNQTGLVDMLTLAANSTEAPDVDWRNYVANAQIQSSATLSLMTSGRLDEDYPARVLDFDWQRFFNDMQGGEFIERLRTQWHQEYEFTLIDSRTGITDSGGICTIMLPDLIVPVFTSNWQSLDGVVEVVRRAQARRRTLAYDRPPALVLPLMSRFDSRTEYESAQEWLSLASGKLNEFYGAWLPRKYVARQALERTSLPYVAYFSFGERLPALSQDASAPDSLGFALNAVSRLIEGHLENAEAVIGSFSDVQTPPRIDRPELVEDTNNAEVWPKGQRSSACQITLLGAPGSGKTTFLAALAIALARRGDRSSSGPWNIVGADSASTDALVSYTSALSSSREFPEATQEIELYQWLLIGRVRRTAKNRWFGARRVDETVQVMLEIADTSGELGGPRRAGQTRRAELIEHLAHSNGIILFIDPVIKLIEEEAFSYLHSILAELAARLIAADALADGYLPHYVAICVTKFDDPRVLAAAKRMNVTSVYPDDPYGFPRVGDGQARDFLVRLMTLSQSAHSVLIVNELERYFHRERIRYFVTSSIGFHVDSRTGTFDDEDPQNVLPREDDSRPRIRGAIYPISVAEPIIWLGSKLSNAIVH